MPSPYARAGAMLYESPMLRYGQPAPAFALPSTSGRTVSLADFTGQASVVLLFYCYDWGGI
jgi:peroxiredoxin